MNKAKGPSLVKSASTPLVVTMYPKQVPLDGMQVDSLVNPLVTSVRTVANAARSMPSSLFKANTRSNGNESFDSLRGLSGIDLEV